LAFISSSKGALFFPTRANANSFNPVALCQKPQQIHFGRRHLEREKAQKGPHSQCSAPIFPNSVTFKSRTAFIRTENKFQQQQKLILMRLRVTHLSDNNKNTHEMEIRAPFLLSARIMRHKNIFIRIMHSLSFLRVKNETAPEMTFLRLPKMCSRASR
jgi:hypothetical protein